MDTDEKNLQQNNSKPEHIKRGFISGLQKWFNREESLHPYKD